MIDLRSNTREACEARARLQKFPGSTLETARALLTAKKFDENEEAIREVAQAFVDACALLRTMGITVRRVTFEPRPKDIPVIIEEAREADDLYREFFHRVTTFPLRPCTFTFGDDDESGNYPGFYDGTTWNGWDNVWVTPEVHAKILADYAEAYDEAGEDDDFGKEARAAKPDESGLVSFWAYGCTTTIIDPPAEARWAALPESAE